jgi:hypothetical protein
MGVGCNSQRNGLTVENFLFLFFFLPFFLPFFFFLFSCFSFLLFLSFSLFLFYVTSIKILTKILWQDFRGNNKGIGRVGYNSPENCPTFESFLFLFFSFPLFFFFFCFSMLTYFGTTSMEIIRVLAALVVTVQGMAPHRKIFSCKTRPNFEI